MRSRRGCARARGRWGGGVHLASPHCTVGYFTRWQYGCVSMSPDQEILKSRCGRGYPHPHFLQHLHIYDSYSRYDIYICIERQAKGVFFLQTR